MLPPHRFDAQPPASRARHAPELRACCWLLVVRENRFARRWRRQAGAVEPRQTRSTASATPIPPPMHSDASPRFASRLT
ncbi:MULTISPECIES: hypothetical protein, partial [Burkholderia]|uniref:hypothetical protein n=1 Tax=Burkholderia TaxID=32008 RepID=UPI001F1A8AC2